MTWIREINIGKENLDAANRVRVSQLTSLGDYKQNNDNQPLFFSEEKIGTASAVYSSLEGGVIMSVDSTSDKVVRQTKMWHPYFAGKSQLFEVTGTDMHPQSGVTKRMGYFSSSTSTPFSSNLDGIFLETTDGGEHTFNVYKSGTQVLSVAQSDWNVDKLDGNGVSGITMSGDNWRRFIVFGADFLYLGGTSVAFGFFFNRKLNICHVYNHAMVNNIIQAPMITSPNQPLRWEIESLENGTQGIFNHICGQVSTEGSVNKIGISRSVDTGQESIATNSTSLTYAIIGIRLASLYRNVTVVPTSISVLGTTNADAFKWSLILNPTVAGVFTYNQLGSAGESSIEFARGLSTNTVTGGIVLSSGYSYSRVGQFVVEDPSLRIGSTISGVIDSLVLCISPVTPNIDCLGAIGFEEFK